MRHLPGTLWQRQRRQRHSPFSIKPKGVGERTQCVRVPVPVWQSCLPALSQSGARGTYNIMCVVCVCGTACCFYGLAAANDLPQGLLGLSDCQSFFCFFCCSYMGFTIAANIFLAGFFVFFFFFSSLLREAKKRQAGRSLELRSEPWGRVQMSNQPCGR